MGGLWFFRVAEAEGESHMTVDHALEIPWTAVDLVTLRADLGR